MRDTMGRWIDGLTDTERDLLVTAPAMNDGATWWDYDDGADDDGDGACGCLIGTVGRHTNRSLDFGRHAEAICLLRADQTQMDVPWQDAPASIRYPQAVQRFGLGRVVRAVKARAARENCIPTAPPARETVGAA